MPAHYPSNSFIMDISHNTLLIDCRLKIPQAYIFSTFMCLGLAEPYVRTVSVDTHVDDARWQSCLARTAARMLVALLQPFAGS